MPCPNYEGENKCGFHSVYYELAEGHIRNFCTTESFRACPEFSENLGEPSLLERASKSLSKTDD